jgi:hypothetical protein
MDQNGGSEPAERSPDHDEKAKLQAIKLRSIKGEERQKLRTSPLITSERQQQRRSITF